MANIEVTLPLMGEGVIEATITRWLVEPDATIELDEPIVEIATDKVDSEIPSPTSGKVIRVFFNEGETPKVGDVIAIINDGNQDTDQDREAETDSISSSVDEKIFLEEKTQQPNQVLSEGPDLRISSFIRHYASQRGIQYSDLIQIKGSGDDGEVLKEDVLNFFKLKKPDLKAESIIKHQKPTVIPEPKPAEAYVPKEGEEIVEIDKTRKIIAEHMVRSVHEAPHVTSIIEVDISHIVQWREKNKKIFFEENNIKLTYTPIITEVVVKAIKEFPRINVSFIQDKLIIKKYINIGIATALPDHNLVVPVIKDADRKNLARLAKDVAELTDRARNNRLKPGETNGGTFTITNLGMVGNITGTPIINQPESAILAVGAIKKKPWAVENKGQYSVGIRDIVTLALSYDHRVIDGALGGAFLYRIGQLLEELTPSF